MCVQNMFWKNPDGEMIPVPQTHYELKGTGQVFPVENPDVWVLSDPNSLAETNL